MALKTLKKIHPTTGSYQDALNNHLKPYENDELRGGDLTKLDAHFEGTSMAFG